VDVEPVFETIVLQVEPPLEDLAILYPTIAEPPLLLGAFQFSIIWENEFALAVSPVGGCGTVVGEAVVADAVLDGELTSSSVIAETR
jgi:hypothetical protein